MIYSHTNSLKELIKDNRIEPVTEMSPETLHTARLNCLDYLDEFKVIQANHLDDGSLALQYSSKPYYQEELKTAYFLKHQAFHPSIVTDTKSAHTTLKSLYDISQKTKNKNPHKNPDVDNIYFCETALLVRENCFMKIVYIDKEKITFEKLHAVKISTDEGALYFPAIETECIKLCQMNIKDIPDLTHHMSSFTVESHPLRIAKWKPWLHTPVQVI
jgi:hypothetical protein